MTTSAAPSSPKKRKSQLPKLIERYYADLEEAIDYRLGNRSALEWVIDQYQLTTDARRGITSDPNREDDPNTSPALSARLSV